VETAIVLCEGHFGKPRGKTAAGLVRHSLRFKILGVVDSANSGRDAGDVLDGKPASIPIYPSVEAALGGAGARPDFLIIGVATIGGMLPPEFREHVKAALERGVSVISGLHEWLADDPEFRAIAERHGATITDIRKEPPLEKMHNFRNLAKDMKSVRIPVLGTDAACGKRTTAVALTKELNARGVKTSFVATGQTGLLQGSKYGVPIDAIRGDYVVGELESAIQQAYVDESPEVIIIEGQGALSHEAYVTGSRAIVSASQPNAVVLQHAPKRVYRTYHTEELHLPNSTIDRETELVRRLAGCDVIAIAINPENMTREEVLQQIAEYEEEYGVPACDVLVDGPGKIADAIVKRFFPGRVG
jgi:uncharacterized NAD-dependent epimerase/dehydratase family protein